MSRTWKDEPYQIRRARLNGKRPPKNWKELVSWRSDAYYRKTVEGWDDLHYTEKRMYRDWYEDEVMGNHDLWWYSWMRLQAPPKWFRVQLNQNYRAKAKMRIKMEDYDNIDRPRRNANWLWW